MPKRKYIYFLEVCWCGKIVYGNHKFCKGHNTTNKKKESTYKKRNREKVNEYNRNRQKSLKSVCTGVSCIECDNIIFGQIMKGMCYSCYRRLWLEEYLLRNPNYYKKLYIERNIPYNQKNPLYRKNYDKEQRRKVIEYYSKGTMQCNCCNENNLIFLTIDHINNDGAKHRKEINKGINSMSSYNFYRWLINNNYPNGFQVLCFNCNIGKYHNGGICPHKNIN